jgi:glycosyltransferase involved in cell wall biosynthesis
VIVSIPLATFNRAPFLKECLDSIFAQTYQDFEVIVVDDGSTDETPQVAATYGDRIRYIRKEHSGFVPTYMHAHSLCVGEYVTYFGDDDVLGPTFLERGVAILESDPSLGKFCSDCYMIDGESKRIGTSTYLAEHKRPSGRVSQEDLFIYGCFVHGGINRRSVLEKIGDYDRSLTHAVDYDLYLRMTGAGYDIYYVDEPLWSYRLHPGMRSHRESEMWTETISLLERNLQRYPEAYARLGKRMDKRLGMNKAWLAVRLFWEWQLGKSIRYALSATRQYPPAVVLGSLQMAYSSLKGKRSVYQSGD